MSVLGVGVGRGSMSAVLLEARGVSWAGERMWRGPDDVARALAELAAEVPRRPRRVRLVLERDLVQVRALAQCPGEAAGWGAVFRQNEGALIATAIRRHRVPGYLAAAAPVALIEALVEGARAAGFFVREVGVGAEVLPAAITARETQRVTLTRPWGAEGLTLARGHVVEARLLRTVEEQSVSYHPWLAGAGTYASRYATAFAAARRKGRLGLVPDRESRTRHQAAVRALRRALAVAAVGWLVAAGAYAYGLGRDARAIDTARRDLAPRLAEVDAVTRELALATEFLSVARTLARERLSQVSRLGRLATGLPESLDLESLEFRRDGVATLSGRSPSPARVAALLEQIPGVVEPRLTASGGSTGSDAPFVVQFRWVAP